MSETIEVREVYCPNCGDDYVLAVDENTADMYVVCNCDDAEAIAEFAEQFTDMFGSDVADSQRESAMEDGAENNVRGYQ